MRLAIQILVMQARRAVHNSYPEWFALQIGGQHFVIHFGGVPQAVGMQVLHVHSESHISYERTRNSLFVILHPPELLIQGFVAPGKIIQTGSFIIG